MKIHGLAMQNYTLMKIGSIITITLATLSLLLAGCVSTEEKARQEAVARETAARKAQEDSARREIARRQVDAAAERGRQWFEEQKQRPPQQQIPQQSGAVLPQQHPMGVGITREAGQPYNATEKCEAGNKIPVYAIYATRPKPRPAPMLPSNDVEGASFNADLVAKNDSKAEPAKLTELSDFLIRASTRKPVRLTVFGLSEPLKWAIDDTTVADISPSGREAFVDFKKDGTAKITVYSGEKPAFHLTAISVTMDDIKRWDVSIKQSE